MTEAVRHLARQAFRIRAGGLLFFAALSLAAPVQAEVYKWVDGQGKVHYSDQPPTVEARSFKSPTAAESAASSEAIQALGAKEQDYQKRQKEAEEARAKADKEAELIRAKRENCTKARNNLATLQNTPRIYTTDTAGQRTYMNDAGRSNALAATRKAISENCN